MVTLQFRNQNGGVERQKFKTALLFNEKEGGGWGGSGGVKYPLMSTNLLERKK